MRRYFSSEPPKEAGSPGPASVRGELGLSAAQTHPECVQVATQLTHH